MTLLLVLSSLVVGVLSGASGVGGVLLIPALMVLGGMNTHEAMGTALASFFFLGIVATWLYYRHGSLDLRMAAPVLLGSLISAYAGAHVNALVSAHFLDLLLASVIIASSLYAMLPVATASLAERLSPRKNWLLLFAIGLFTGFVCGMTGAGGGILSVPIMILFGYSTLPVIATGQILQCTISLSGSISNIANDFVIFHALWWITLCEIVGIVIGCRIAHAVPVGGLKRGITLLCLALGIFLAVRSFLF